MRRTDVDAGIHCPNCGCTFSSVVNTESITNAIRRRRECLECGVRWTTYECIGRQDDILKRKETLLKKKEDYINYAREATKNMINGTIEALQKIEI